jgi:hypothetical protein
MYGNKYLGDGVKEKHSNQPESILLSIPGISCWISAVDIIISIAS